MDAATGIVDAVHQLKVDCDTWQAIALQYKAGFESQTARLRELQDICFATQAELENERTQHRRLRMDINDESHDYPLALKSTDQSTVAQAFGTALILSPKRTEMSWTLNTPGQSGNPIFSGVQQLLSRLHYDAALRETERLLRGPLSPKARVEGLMLKSRILRATGPDFLYDALAACSEALELCDRIAGLQSFLPKIQYQRGLYCYQLCMLQQAKEAFSAASEDDLLSEHAHQYRRSCDAELEMRQHDRRSAFDENRSSTTCLLAELEDGSSRSNLRRTSAQITHRATQKFKRMSLPYRWLSASTD